MAVSSAVLWSFKTIGEYKLEVITQKKHKPHIRS